MADVADDPAGCKYFGERVLSSDHPRYPTLGLVSYIVRIALCFLTAAPGAIGL